MKRIKQSFLVSICFVVTLSCNPSSGDSGKFDLSKINSVINKRPNEVERIFGQPDSTYNLKIFNREIIAQRYGKSNVEIRYLDSLSAEVIVYGPHDLNFSPSSLEVFDIRNAKNPDQYIKNQVIRWHDLEEFETVAFYDPKLDSAGNVKNFTIFFKAKEEKKQND